MNRREFVKALAGIPLLGLLVKLPETEEQATYELNVGDGSANRTLNVRFEDWEAEQMRDPEFRAAAEELEPAHQTGREGVLGALRSSGLHSDPEDYLIVGDIPDRPAWRFSNRGMEIWENQEWRFIG